MTKTATKPKYALPLDPLLMDREERLRVINNIRGMWKNRKPDPMKELAKIRKGLDRKLP